MNEKNKEYIFATPFFYKDNNHINNGLLCLIIDVKERIKSIEEISNINECKIKIYTKDLKEKNSFKICLENNWYFLLSFGLYYYYKKNILLIFTEEKILQISLKTEQIISIYKFETFIK